MIVGTAEHYAQFVALARDRIAELGIPYATVDQICGFPERYTSILMTGRKSMSVYSFFTLAAALALDVCFVHDGADLARLKARQDWIARRVKRKKIGRLGGAIRFHNDTEFYRKIGLKGAIRKHALSKFYKERARKAARARWSKNNGRQERVRAGNGNGSCVHHKPV